MKEKKTNFMFSMSQKLFFFGTSTCSCGQKITLTHPWAWMLG